MACPRARKLCLLLNSPEEEKKRVLDFLGRVGRALWSGDSDSGDSDRVTVGQW
jgi:hypothetical protein